MTISGATAPLIQRLLPALAVPTTPHVAMFTLIRGGAPLVELDGLRESILCARSAYRKVSTSVPDYVVFHEGNEDPHAQEEHMPAQVLFVATSPPFRILSVPC